MPNYKVEPNWKTGVRGTHWSTSLRAAYRHGATIVVEETGVPVTYARLSSGVCIRPWIDEDGNRFDSRDLIPIF